MRELVQDELLTVEWGVAGGVEDDVLLVGGEPQAAQGAVVAGEVVELVDA